MKKYFFSALFITFSFLTASCSNEKIGASSVEKNSRKKSALETAIIDGYPAQINPGNYITFDSVEELSNIADLIVIAQPLNNLNESKKISKKQSETGKGKVELNTSVVVRDADGLIIDYYNLTPVQIKKTLKGNPPSKVIGVLQSGAVVDENSQTFVMAMEGFTPLEKASKYLLFLKKIDASVNPNLTGMYSMISVNQGKFNFDNSDKQEESYEAKDPQYRSLKEKVKGKYKQEFDSAQ